MSLLKRYLSLLIKKCLLYDNYIKLEKLKADGILSIGKHTYGSPIVDVYRNSERKLLIGKFCSISPEVRFITGGIHPIHWVSLFPIRDKMSLNMAYDGTPTSNGDISVGNDVWIGTGATILSGVDIGHGSVILAGSVISKNVPPYAIVGGVPGKIIKYRFSSEEIERLLSIKWWNWSDDKIVENIKLLNGSNVSSFTKKFSDK